MIARSMAPYADPIRRRKIRTAAKALVACSPWPGKNADGGEIAQLALVRLLWLQREAHQAARAGHSESVALLARTVIETSIVGLYCLVAPDSPSQLSDQNVHQLAAMLRYLPRSFVSEGTRKRMIENLGTPSRNPSTWVMAEAVDEANGDDEAKMLYRAFYTPLSSFFAHGGGTSLLRHVGPGDHLTEHPASPWFHRSALHITDSCVALLASRIARGAGAEFAIFDNYYEAHRSRTITPVMALGGRGLVSTIRWRDLPSSVRAIVRLRSYLSTDAAKDTAATRENKVRASAGSCFAFMRQPDDEDMFHVMVDALVDAVNGDDGT